ncbi:MAG: DUF3857 domain-containing protein [Myxococcaceae bacterium]|nr:DUF3857 domain-containing protein [Myxococcaceae bacterium]
MLLPLAVALLSAAPAVVAPPPPEDLASARAQELATRALNDARAARGAAHLVRLHTLRDEVQDLNLLAEPYAAILFRRAADPLVRFTARRLYADLERARGRTQRAKELLAPLGFVQDFAVVGGFDNEGKRGCDTDFGPESAPDFRALYPGKAGDVAWQRLTEKPSDGVVDLSLAVRPSSEVVAYGLTFLEATAETRVALGVGASGAFRLFVNGAKVAARDDYNAASPDQARVEVRLRKGLNRVLVKVCQQSGPLAFWLRQERPDGERLDAKVTLPDVVPPLEKGPPPAPRPLPTLAEAMRALVKQSPKDARLRADEAVVLEWTKAFDLGARLPALEAQTAAELPGADEEVLRTAAALSGDDHNEARALLTRAATPGSSGLTRLALARLELDRDFPIRALPMLDALLQESPRSASVQVARARALEALGEKAKAERALEAAYAAMHLYPLVAREAVALSRRLQRLNEAVERARAAVALRFDDLESRRLLASLLSDAGNADGAIDALERILVLDPYDLSTRLRLAELLCANGKLEQGQARFAEARALAPTEAEVSEREGRAYLAAGKEDDGVAALQRSLKLRPQATQVKDMLRALRGGDVSAGTRWAIPVAQLLAETGDDAADDAVILADVTATRVQASGLASRFSQLVVRVQHERGVEAFRQLPIPYSPDRQEVRVLKARLTRPDGSVVESHGDNEQSVNEPWTGMYYDTRARVLTFPALAAGDVLEVQWRLDDTASENLLSDYFGAVDGVQSTFPKRHYRYVVEMPKARPLYWNQVGQPAWFKASQEASSDGFTAFRFEAAQVPKVVPEPQMPGASEVGAVLHVSTYQTWQQVSRYWWGLVREQLKPNDELQKTVDLTLKGIDRKDTRKVVAALYNFVVSNTRYVALEFGIHGYQPYRVDRVLARRFGDCKDKASLLVAMLKLAGVDADLVLLRMRHLGQLGSEPASLSAFNHAIAYVPALDWYLDGTAEFGGATGLPSADRQANVLVVNGAGEGVFRTTPEAKADDNPTTMELQVALTELGAAEVSGSLEVRGQGAPETRRAYQAAGARKHTFEQAWAQSFPGMSVDELTVSDVTRLEDPVKLGFRFHAPRWAEALPSTLRFFPFGAGRAFTQAMAPLVDRKLDAFFPGVWKNVFHVTYTAPAGWVVGEVPAPLDLTSPFGRFTLTAKAGPDGKLHADGELAFTQPRVSAKDYPAFRAWLLEVDQAFGRKLVLQKQGGGQTASREVAR